MEKYKKYYGILLFIVVATVTLMFSTAIIKPKISSYKSTVSDITSKQSELNDLSTKLQTVQNKIKKIKNSIIGSQKKIYAPLESDLGNDTLFFTLYNDVIEMVHANSIKIKSIDYEYNPESDEFVKFGKETYFVCDVDLELVSNYINIGKLIQDIYQYPYYIRINSIEVKPYAKDKKVLFAKLSIRLYAHTAPESETAAEKAEKIAEASKI